ncbi:DDR2 [Lepeophtheirus salmonis]|uniref:DDR2 n=2 Tax=Lepeophtheirus salmonis TaxID=72036 RepID=A0A7R8D897_LEPSM|nr:DDR2 [Lepeophtheirus salmonis]CAF3034917.1 DDR2 [Lepeophtheirus salmonis]
MGAWSIKSDIWSFGVTLWEIFNNSHSTVFEDLNDEQVIENLNHWYHSDGFHLLPSNRSLTCSKEISDLMNECWSRDPDSRPKFSEIHTFLNNKVLGHIPWCGLDKVKDNSYSDI